MLTGINRIDWRTVNHTKYKRTASGLIQVEISASIGELVDKIRILEIKSSRFEGAALSEVPCTDIVEAGLETLTTINHQL